MNAASNLPDPPDRLMIIALARTGMRRGELFGFTVDAVVQIGTGYWLRTPRSGSSTPTATSCCTPTSTSCSMSASPTATKILDLPLQLRDPLGLSGRGAGTLARIDLGLLDAVPQRLRVDPQLVAHPPQRPAASHRITPQADRHLDRPLPKPLGVLPRCCHGSHPLLE